MKKLFLLFIVFIFGSCESTNPQPPSLGDWKQLNDYPGNLRSNGQAISFSILGKGYFGLGGNSVESNLKDLWSYDANSNTWEKKQDPPIPLPAVAVVTINTKAYVLTYSGSLYEYDSSLDSWKYLSMFPRGARPGITGFAINGLAYFGTGNGTDGSNFKVYKDFWKYDPAQNSWIQMKDFPIEITSATSFVVNGKAFVGMGFDGLSAPPISKFVWGYDATTDQWGKIADFPGYETLVGIVFSSNSRGYVGVSENDTSHKGKVYEYNPYSDVWRQVRKFPSEYSLDTESFTIDNRMFVVGGWWSDYSNQVWEFIP